MSQNCFPASTLISLPSGQTKPIRDIRIGDEVLAFDPHAENGRGALVPREVTRLIENVTQDWIKVTFADGTSITMTPGHHMLTPDGRFEEAARMIDADGCIDLVRDDGTVMRGKAERIAYSAETAHLYEQHSILRHQSIGNLALAPTEEHGWRTYNFEVSGLHTYVADGVRVHNESIYDAVADDIIAGRLVVDGNTQIGIETLPDGTTVNHTVLDANGIPTGTVIVQGDGTRVYYSGEHPPGDNQTYVSTVITEYPGGGAEGTPSRIVTEWVSQNGVRNPRNFDYFDEDGEEIDVPGTAPTPSFELDFDEDGDISGGVVDGQGLSAAGMLGTIGSSIGGLLGGDDFGSQLLGRTVGGTFAGLLGNALFGAIDNGLSGGEFTTALSESLSGSLGGLPSSFLTNGIGNLRSGISSLLVGELADALNIDGFEGVLFNAAGTTITNHLLQNATTLVLEGSINGLTGFEGLFSGFASDAFFTSMSGSVGGALGSYLAHQVYTVQSQFGSIGGSIGGAIGSIIGSFAPIPFLGTAVGNFIGTFLGSVIGDNIQEAYYPDKAWGGISLNVTFNEVDVIDVNRIRHGNTSFIEAILGAQQEAVADTVDSMHGTISGAAFTLGYWDAFPNANLIRFYDNQGILSMSVAEEAGTTRVDGNIFAVHTGEYTIEVPGHWENGMQGESVWVETYFVERVDSRSHQEAMIYAVDSGGASLLRNLRFSDGDALQLHVLETSTAITLSGLLAELQVARDYSNFLQRQGEISAIMRFAPDSAFATGWALTLLRAGELGLQNVQNHTFWGDTGNDSILGFGGNDRLYGEAGDDILIGGAGVDQLNGGAGNDSAAYTTASAGVVASLVAPSSNTGDAAGDIYTSIEGLIGSGHNDTLTGDGQDNTLDGEGGNDTLYGLAGNDTIRSSAGNDIIDGGDGSDTLVLTGNRRDYAVLKVGNAYEILDMRSGALQKTDLVSDVEYFRFADGVVPATQFPQSATTGTSGNDTLTGTSGDDQIAGQDGSDTLHGLDGNDTLFAGGGAQNWLLGGAGTDTLVGGAGQDVLDGGAGADILYGGAQFDYAWYASAGSGVTASLTTPAFNVGDAAGDTYFSVEGLIGTQFDDSLTGDGQVNVLFGEGGNDILLGGAGNDQLYGGEGVVDYLDGGAGADLLDGGAGFDYAWYGSATAGVTASLSNFAANSGDAAGDVYVSIEGLYGSQYDDVFTGSSGNDVLLGEGGNDTLYGLDGSDTLNGGAGFDYAAYSNAAAAVVASLASGTGTGGEATGDTYANIEGLVGSEHNDALTGDAQANTLYGQGGNDTLSGLDGNDTLYAGEGAWNYLYGGAGIDTLIGGSGVDYLDAGTGGDALDGGTGFDYAWYGSTTARADGLGVTASLSSPSSNTRDAVGDTYANIEGLLGSEYNDTLTGDAQANALYGQGGNDYLYGLDGNDALVAGGGQNFWLYGGNGSDTLYGGTGLGYLDGGAGADTLIGNDGFDYAWYGSSTSGLTVSLATPSSNTGDAAGDSYTNIEGLLGSAFADTLIGNGQANYIIAGTGDDAIDGGAGNDYLWGQGDNDRFVYSAAGFGQDTIMDFVAGDADGDVIEFRTSVFANWQAVLAASTQVGADTVISLNANDRVTLQNVTIGAMNAGDFLFVA